MDDDEVRRRVAEARVGHLGTVDVAGRPHVMPFCFVLDDKTLYSPVDQKPKQTTELKRLENIRRNPSVTVLVDHYEEEWSRLWWARLTGQARLLEEGPERERAIGLLVQKYEQYRAAAPVGTVIAVDVDRWGGWSAA